MVHEQHERVAFDRIELHWANATTKLSLELVGERPCSRGQGEGEEDDALPCGPDRKARMPHHASRQPHRSSKGEPRDTARRTIHIWRTGSMYTGSSETTFATRHNLKLHFFQMECSENCATPSTGCPAARATLVSNFPRVYEEPARRPPRGRSAAHAVLATRSPTSRVHEPSITLPCVSADGDAPLGTRRRPPAPRGPHRLREWCTRSSRHPQWAPLQTRARPPTEASPPPTEATPRAAGRGSRVATGSAGARAATAGARAEEAWQLAQAQLREKLAARQRV